MKVIRLLSQMVKVMLPLSFASLPDAAEPDAVDAAVLPERSAGGQSQAAADVPIAARKLRRVIFFMVFSSCFLFRVCFGSCRPEAFLLAIVYQFR